MPKAPKEKNINLIPQDEFESSTAGRILKWALSTFRIMVIATELVVMAAFLSRFWLDARNSDLNEELEIKKSQVTAYKDVEEDMRKYQTKLSIVKSLYFQNKISQVIKTFTGLIPNDVYLDSIILKEGLLTIKAESLTESSIAQALVNLENNTGFSEINLTQVSKHLDSNSTLFTITTKINEGGFK